MDLTKPARLQVDSALIPDDDKPPQTGHTFNIWFHQWAGGDPTAKELIKLNFRLDVVRDSGYTRAIDGRTSICLFYARGCCYKGKECSYVHRPPKPEDFRIHTQDCFGRDKTADYRDDMGGVGLLGKVNKTLYVGGIIANDKIHEQVLLQFLEFGAIDRIKVLPAKNCAFVTFRLESEAQFAKEAMNSQSLGENDVLSVKWSNEDMDPDAQALTQHALDSLAMETVKRLLEDSSSLSAIKKTKTKRSIDSTKEQEIEQTVSEIYGHELNGTGHTEAVSKNGGIIDSSRLQTLRKAVLNRSKEKKSGNMDFKSAEKSDTTCLALPNTFLSGYSSDEGVSL